MTDEQHDADPGSPAAIAALGWRRWIIIAVVLLAAAGLGATLALLDHDAPAAAGLPAVIIADPDDEPAAPDADVRSDKSPAAQATSDTAPPEPALAPAESAPAEQATAVEDADAVPSPPEAPPDEPPSDVVEGSADEQAPAVEPPQDEPVGRPHAPPAPRRFWADLAVWYPLAPEPEPSVEPPAPATPPPPAPVTVDIGPFAMPIAGACFPEFAGQLPGAPRDYRNGIHEGVDFYPGWACAEIVLGTPVLAIGEGRVIRADWDYAELTNDLYWEMEARGFAGPDDLDIFRGRQVWVDHGDGVVARYAHLSGIAEGIAEGAPVTAGDVLGFIGESGTPGALRQPGSEIHLHFELRIGDGYLGEGEGAERALALYRAVFPDGP